VDKQVQPIVLIAQSIGDGRLHAIERVQDGIYALCKLGSWVTLRALKRLSAQGCDHGTPRKIQTVEQDQTSACEWWRVATVEPDRGTNPNFNTSFIDGKPTNVRLSLQRSVQNCITQSVTTRDEVSPLLQSKPTETMVGTVLEEASQPPEEVLELIKSQYLETLYASKVGVIYLVLLDAITNYRLRRRWHTSRKDLSLELELPFMLAMHLLTTSQNSYNI